MQNSLLVLFALLHYRSVDLYSQEVRDVDGRVCQVLTFKSNSSVILFSLPERVDRRIVVPFSVNLSHRTGSNFEIFLGSGQPKGKNGFFYLIRIGEETVLGKIQKETRSVRILQKSRRRLFSSQNVASDFYIRLKLKPAATSIGLYEANADASDPVVSHKDDTIDDTNNRLKTFGFAVQSAVEHSFTAEISFRCQSRLRAKCIHSVECLTRDASCPSYNSEAVCMCDDGLIEDSSGAECVRNPIRIGDECSSTRQCSALRALCRPQLRNPGRKGVKTHHKKICLCAKTHQVNQDGVCQEHPDHGQLDFTQLRRRVVLGGQPLIGRMLARPSHGITPVECDAVQNVSGPSFYHRLATARVAGQVYPLRLEHHGFRLGFFIQGVGSLLLRIVHVLGGNYDGNIVPLIDIHLGDGRLLVRVGQQWMKGLADIGFENLPPFTRETYVWASVTCANVTTVDNSCKFECGQKDVKIFSTDIANPWRHPARWPTHYTFVPQTSTSVFHIRVLCKSSWGQPCRHSQDCRTSPDLECRMDDTGFMRCVCGRNATWDPAIKTCVRDVGLFP